MFKTLTNIFTSKEVEPSLRVEKAWKNFKEFQEKINKLMDEQSKTSKRGAHHTPSESERGRDSKKSPFSLLSSFIPPEDALKR
jgi:hypothetical protein